MTSPTNEPGGQGADLAKTAPEPQTVVANIDTYLVDSMPVFDQHGKKVGEVKLHSSAAGYLMVEYGAFEHKYLYIPFRLIRSIDPDEIFVSETKDTLTSRYTQPPTTSAVVYEQLVPGPDGGMTEQTREAQVTQSGYDDKPTTVNSVDVGGIADRLAVGMLVYDVTGERLGELTQFTVARRLLKVEKGVVSPRVLYVPFSVVERVEPGTFRVYLSLPRDVLLKEYTVPPKDA